MGPHSAHSAHNAPIDRILARFDTPDEPPTLAPETPPRASVATEPPVVSPADLPPDLYELWGERAAIREYCGGFSTEQAEALALADVLRQADPLAEKRAAAPATTAGIVQAPLFWIESNLGPYGRRL